MTEVVDDMNVNHEDAVARTFPEYAQIYVKYSFRVFWAIGLLFLFNMAMPVEALIFLDPKYDEEWKAINAPPTFTKSGYTVKTYGDIRGSPIPAGGYLEDLESALNMFLKHEPESGCLADGHDADSSNVKRVLPCAEIMNCLRKHSGVHIQSVAFTVSNELPMYVSGSNLLVIAKLTDENGAVFVSKSYRFVAMLDGNTDYLVKCQFNCDCCFACACGPIIKYEIQPNRLAVVKHVMKWSLPWRDATEVHLTSVDVPSLPYVKKMLVAVAAVKSGERVRVVGKMIGCFAVALLTGTFVNDTADVVDVFRALIPQAFHNITGEGGIFLLPIVSSALKEKFELAPYVEKNDTLASNMDEVALRKNAVRGFTAKPVKYLVELRRFDDLLVHKEVDAKEMEAINAPPTFKHSRYTVNIYGDIKGSPIPSGGYLRDLESALNLYLKRDSESTNGDDGHTEMKSKDADTSNVKNGLPCADTMKLLRMRLDDEDRKREIHNIEFGFPDAKSKGVSCNTLVLTAMLTDTNGQVLNVTGLKFFAMLDDDADYLVKLTLFGDCKKDAINYEIHHDQSAFVQHVMKWSLPWGGATEVHLASVDVGNDNRMLVAAAAFNWGGTVGVVGKMIGRFSVAPMMETFVNQTADVVDVFTSLLVQAFHLAVREDLFMLPIVFSALTKKFSVNPREFIVEPTGMNVKSEEGGEYSTSTQTKMKANPGED
eukprot:GHVS01002685.1.p1 GENE.GHVS01002685.1~~GHVS01002685.1.p1  ORF type:complete len:711 (+),score=76.16 GHVS01002685.1:41-2173(+)